MPGLLSLPTELMLDVIGYLDPLAIDGFRLSCKTVNSFIQPKRDQEFSQRHHRVIIEHRKLEMLLAIAENPKMSHLVKKMILANHVYSEATSRRTSRDKDGSDFLDNDYKSEGYMERNILKVSGEARRLLAQAFQQFKNLRTIGIVNELADRKDSTNWYDSLMEQSDEDENSKESLVPLILLALADAGARPTEIYIEENSDYSQADYDQLFRLPLSLDAFTIPPRSKIPHVLNGLTSLNLGLRLTEDEEYHWETSPGIIPARVSLLTSFMSHLASLTTLTIWCDGWQPLASSFLASLCGIYGDELGSGLKRLRELELSHVSAPTRVFIAICSRFKLDKLKLFCPIITYDVTEEGRLDYWRIFLRMLSDELKTKGLCFKRFQILYPAQWPYSRLSQLDTALEDSIKTPVEILFKGARGKGAYTDIVFNADEDTGTVDQWLKNSANKTKIYEEEWRKLGL